MKQLYDHDADGNPIYMHRRDPTGQFVPLESDDANDGFWYMVLCIAGFFMAVGFAFIVWAH